jgi:signal transduction histidine kinase
MSQEFRAPLEAILGQAEALRAALPGDAREQQSLQGIVIAGQYLGDLLNQLLEMGRVEADETSVRIEPVAVAEIVAPCLAIIGPRWKSAALP